MKRTSHILALFAALAVAPLALAAPEKSAANSGESKASNPAVAEIKKYREENEVKVRENKLSRKEVPLTGAGIKESIRQKWTKMDAYSDGGKVVRLQLYPHKEFSSRTEEFYLRDGKLVFAFIHDKAPKQEGADEDQAGKELYFRNGKLLMYQDRSGEPEANAAQEKKMYETRLPYEVAELLEILKAKK